MIIQIKYEKGIGYLPSVNSWRGPVCPTLDSAWHQVNLHLYPPKGGREGKPTSEELAKIEGANK